jgi:hypothetical protein
MIIRVEPKDWNMHTVLMFFKQEEPHPEDVDIRRYLEERHLEPRRKHDTELEGEKFEVLTYGGCYLGRHMNALADIQRAVVERELLAEAIPALLAGGPDAETAALATTKTVSEMTTIVDALTDALHTPDNFGIDANGELQTTISAEDVQAHFITLTADI